MKRYRVLKILSTVAYVLVTAFLLYSVIDAFPRGEESSLDFALTYAIIVIMFGAIGYGINLIPAVIGLILSAISVKRGNASLGSLAYFIVFILLPIITYLGMVLILPIIHNGN